MSAIKLIFSTLVITLSFAVTSTYATTLPTNTEVVPVEIEKAENLSQLRVFVVSNTGSVGTPVTIYTSVVNPVQSLTILVNGQPIASSNSGRLVASFTPPAAGDYIIVAKATYAPFSVALSRPVTYVAN